MLKLTKIFLLLLVSANFAQSPLLTLMDDGITYEDETLSYISRVESDGGVVINKTLLNDFIIDAKANGYYDSLLCAVDANWGIKKNSNNKVTKLYDLFGLRDYAQSDTSKSPTWSAASQNSLAGLRFDGSNDRLDVSYIEHVDAQPLAGFVTVNLLNASGNFIDNTNKRIIFGVSGGTSLYIYNGGALADTSAFTVGVPYIYAGVFSGASSRIYKNNVLKMTGNAGTDGWGFVGDVENYHIGGSGSSSWTKIIVYNFIVKSGIGNISTINTFINAQYSIY